MQHISARLVRNNSLRKEKLLPGESPDPALRRAYTQPRPCSSPRALTELVQYLRSRRSLLPPTLVLLRDRSCSRSAAVMTLDRARRGRCRSCRERPPCLPGQDESGRPGRARQKKQGGGCCSRCLLHGCYLFISSETRHCCVPSSSCLASYCWWSLGASSSF